MQNKSKILLIKKASRDLGIKVSSDYSYGELKNLNDAYYWTLVNYIERKKIKKIAYPIGYPGEQESEVDISKWLDTVYLIYMENKKTGEPIWNLLEKYTKSFDKDKQEDINFKNWFKFYYSGENLKYSSRKESMKKNALFSGGLGQSADNYTHTTFDLPGSSFTSAVQKANVDLGKKDDGEPLRIWKDKIHQACRRLDRLLREPASSLTPNQYLDLAQLLLQFSHKIMEVKLTSTAADLTYQFADKLKKLGLSSGSEMMIKTAQDAAQQAESIEGSPAPAEPSAQPIGAPAPTAEGSEAAPATPEAEDNSLKSKIPSPDDVEPASLKDIKPIPGPKEGEYDNFFGDVNLDDAASKLDEVAGMLSDRRIIRLLAEFDIMLDKIGIAAMFPELAEAQSKLIDGYSYALTRVTKMMGQLANAKMLIESGGPAQSQEEEAAKNPEVPKPEEAEAGE
jgi:hypothetical protein